MSLMVNLVMDFYAITGYTDNKLDYNVKLLYKLYDKKLSVMFEKKAKNMEELLKKSKHNPEYYEGSMKVTTFRDGTLLIDMIDRKTNKIVWRTNAQGNEALVDLKLLLARPTHADTPALPLKVRPAAHEAG